MRFVPNLTMLFTEVPFLERFAAARRAGFDAVEFQFPYKDPLEDVQRAVAEARVEVVLFNLPAGNFEGGERGIGILPDRRQEFQEGVALALEYATALGCRRLNCLSGIVPAGLNPQEARETFVDNLRLMVKSVATRGITPLIEPCNLNDMPGFFLHQLPLARSILAEEGLSEVRIQFDVYHTQRMHGELIRWFQRLFPVIGHVQIADNPGRHEPGTGEIHYQNVLRSIQEAGYEGDVGLEYFPLVSTEDSLRWLREHRAFA